MKGKSLVALFFCLTGLTLLLGFAGQPSVSVEAAEAINFTSEELAWIEDHPDIRLAPDPDFSPIEIIDSDGVYSGIAADFVKLLEERLPLKFEIVQLDSWTQAIRQAKSRKIDMFGAAVPTPERLEYLSFTQPYLEFPAVVLVRDSAEHFPTLSELKGKRVAVVANYADHEYMKRAHPQIPLEVMPDISSGLRQVSFGKVDAMVLNLASASYYIQKDGISNLKVTEDTDFIFDLSFAVRSDWAPLIPILEKGLAAISAAEKKAVMDRWISLGSAGWRPSPLFVISLLSILLLLALLAILYWNRSLQRLVGERTVELEQELADRIEAEKEKEKLLQEVHRAKKMKAIGVLAGGVAHDLNNILAGAVGYSDLVMRKIANDSPLQYYFKEIRESGRRAAAVVADLLTISRDAAAERTVVDLNLIIKEYQQSAEQQNLVANYPAIEFRFSCSDAQLKLACSVVHLKKSLMNLVINAAEATQQGVVTVRTAELTDRERELLTAPLKSDNYVVLSVEDNGPGIADEDLEHIFDPFFTKKKLGHSGTGLGLAVVWNTLQEHQGHIEVTRPASGGSCFALYLPASDGDLEQTFEHAVRELEGQGEHVLVIDDEEHIRILATGLLSDLGYRVSTAASGEEAIRFLQKHPQVDLLLLDMLMDPGLNGYQTYKQVKSFLPDQKALISSGFSESEEVKQTLALGASGYLKKPYTLADLGVAIKQALS